MTQTLLFAPHPDDEIMGAGAHLAMAPLRGDVVQIVIVSDGAAGANAALRRAEALAAAPVLGLAESAWIFWDYPDGALPVSAELRRDIRNTVARFRPHRILLPAPTEQHPDHRRLTRAVILSLTGHWRGELWFYETTSPMPAVNCVQAAGDAWDIKQAALACHASQLAQHDYIALTNAMGGLRGAAAGCDKAEGFLVFDWDGSPQNFFETSPLLSVVVRASQPQFLVHALASLAAQQYDMIEVVLVWFGEVEPPLAVAPTLHIVQVAGVANRAANLNLGVTAASGEFVAILDEDDVVDEDHYVNLITELRANARMDVAYTGTRLCRCCLEGGDVKIEAALSEFTEVVTPSRLLLGNVVPIHAFLCRTGLLRSYPFDEGLEAYEDWDVLLRMAFDGKRFSQVEGVSAEYRLFGDEADLVERHRKRGYERWGAVVQMRHVAKLCVADLASLHATQNILRTERDQARAEAEAARSEAVSLRAVEQQAQRMSEVVGRVAACIDTPINASTADVRVAASALSTTGPCFSIVMPVYNTEPSLLEEAVQSVFDQSYTNWHLCMVDDGSSDEQTLATLRGIATAFDGDPRVRLAKMPRNQGIVATSNVAASLSDAAWIAFLDHDDRLHHDALFELALGIVEQAQVRMAYTDNRLIDRAGALLNTYHKPAWSPTLLLSCNYINHFMAIQRTLFNEVGGLSERFEGAQDYGLVLACARRLAAAEVLHIPKALYDWRTTETSVAYEAAQKPHSASSSFKAIEHHLAQLALPMPQTSWDDAYPGIYAAWQAPEPSLHVIIASRDNEAGLARVLDALLESKATWSATVILTRATPEYGRDLQARLADRPNIQWQRDERALNWAASVNRVARRLNGKQLLFASDEVVPRHADWLARLRRYLALPDVGVVGARLHRPDGSLLHLGLTVDRASIAQHIDDWGPRHERALSREVSAVRHNLMLIDASLFQALGGFDERLSAWLADVDFCLQARIAGRSVVLAADVSCVVGAESDGSQGLRQLAEEQAIMRIKWQGVGMLAERYDTRYLLEFRSTRILHVAKGEK